PTAFDCQYTSLEGRGGAVTFDNAKQVTLPPTLAALITILISNGEESPDELVAWRSIDRVGELMQKRLGRAFSAHAVSQLVWRLRAKLAGAGLDPRLVESSPASGLRLRLKRQAAGVCAE
ncbi:MAG: helix-turn-helix domain-containing protein, partial [Candidatus Solibacter sp.]|nr:helix-turn-helix domain-containing protein [Candidatus Solibacter sp.]